jgi:hypothetical protein
MAGPSVERRLIQALAVIALIAVTGVVLILPYRLYERDIRRARVEAHRLSSVVHVAVSDAMLRDADVSDLLNRIQGLADFEMRLRPLGPGEPLPMGDRKGVLTRSFGTDLVYTAPSILDSKGQAWIAEMQFDLSPMKRESIRIIIDLVIAVVLGSLTFSLAIFFLIRNRVLQPLKNVTRALERMQDTRAAPLPDMDTREMQDLTRAIDQVRGLASS